MATRYRLPGTVYDAALRRIRWLWDEFDGQVSVSTSGGKDSTVVLELALIVARERDALPLKVQWLDQECEYQSTLDYQTATFARPEVAADWYQIPFRLFNATDHANPWLNVWGEGEEWIREKDPSAIHENTFGIDRFTDLLTAIGDRRGGAVLTGVRAEESPARRVGLTSWPSYKWVTWGKKTGLKHHRLFHPIYDWSHRDVWKAINDGGWRYSTHYDQLHRYGVSARNMRVSNYHHETAISNLFMLQEIEPETWQAAVQRLNGINTAGHLGFEDFYIRELPFMFRSWEEYHAYLVDHLVAEENRETFRRHFTDLARRLPYVDREEIAKATTQAVIANDIYFTKGNQFYVAHHQSEKRRAAGF